MERIKIKEAAKAVGGSILCGSGEGYISSVSTDSREITEGTLFIPIIGERVDGHRFLASAFEAGAAAVFTSEHEKEDFPSKAEGAPEAVTEKELPRVYIKVADTLKALQDLAAWYRRQFAVPVIGITGSVGKTTTKEMVAAALETRYRVLKTEGNMNSQIGLPLMMLRLEKQHEIAVIEMGMSEAGEMARLARIAKPDMAVVTNIGVSHIGQLGTQENIRREKLNLINEFTEGSRLFLNGDDTLLAEIGAYKEQSPKNASFGEEGGVKLDLTDETKERLSFCQVSSYGIGDSCTYQAANIRSIGEETYFTMVCGEETEKIVLSVLGLHNVGNALAALAVANACGIPAAEAKKGLKDYAPIAMRGQIKEKNGIKVIDDTYNASPDSMKSGVDVLLSMEGLTGRAAVLADVLELGERSRELHYDVGKSIAAAGLRGTRLDCLITVGREAAAIGTGALDTDPELKVICVLTNEEAVMELSHILKPGYGVLVKGSRGMHTEEIVEAILERG